MTFHANNGTTLTKEEENLTPEQRERIIEAKRRVNEEANRKLEESLGGAREYYKESESAPIATNEEVDSAMELVNKIDRQKADEAVALARQMTEPKAKEGSKNSTPTQNYGAGAFGTLRNEDFSAYRERRDAERRRQREAVAAGNAAANAKREELLGTGMYFDDGRGNIKLKKEYRKQGVNNVPYRRGHFNKDTEHNTHAEATGQAISSAGQAAYDAAMSERNFESALARQKDAERQARRAKTQEMVELNGFERAQLESAKARRAVGVAKGHVSIYRGLVTALKALDSNDRAEQTWRERTETGLLRGADGRPIGVGPKTIKEVAAKETGYRQNGETRSGIVGVKAIDAINSELAANGNKQYRLTGIIAQQGVDAIGNKRPPTFYVQGVRADGTAFGKTMTMEQVYNFGKENLVNSGTDANDAEDDVIDDIGDVLGVRKKQEAERMRDPKYRESVAKAKLAEYRANNPNWLSFEEKLQLQRESDAAKLERAQVSQKDRKETEEERTKRHREGQVRAWDSARYSAIQRTLDGMRRAKLRGHTGAESRKYTDEQIAAEEKRLLDLMDSDRAKAFPELYGQSPRQAPPSSGDNSGDGRNTFKQLSKEEYDALSPEQKAQYKTAWMAWRKSGNK